MRAWLHMILALILVASVAGVARVAAAVPAESDGCCSEGEESTAPNAPDEPAAEGCAPNCSDCMCPTYLVVGVCPTAAAQLQIETVEVEATTLAYAFDSPTLPGLFRPPQPQRAHS